VAVERLYFQRNVARHGRWAGPRRCLLVALATAGGDQATPNE
jgi:hypothetical protein